MRKISAALVAAALASGFVLVAQPAVAAEVENPNVEVCYADETHTELTWELQETHWVSGPTPAIPAVPDAYLTVGNFTETRATGHYEATPDGLHIWTEGATSTDKVAGYLGYSFPLSSVTSASVDYTAVTGIEPGAQLVISSPTLGNGILVGESVYGDNWWLTNGSSDGLKGVDPSGAEDGGNGSAYFGTLAQWAAAAPDATVVAIGFSLGSGVLGEGTVHGVEVNGTLYEFTYFVAGTPEVPAQPEVYSDWATVEEGQSVELPDGHEDGVQFYDEGWYRYVITGEVDVTEKVEVECPPPTEEPEPTEEPTPTETPKPSATAVPTSTNQLADTGFDGTSFLVLAAGGLVVGTIILVTARVRSRKQ